MHANGGYLVIIFQKYFNFNWPLEIFREELSFNLKELEFKRKKNRASFQLYKLP